MFYAGGQEILPLTTFVKKKKTHTHTHTHEKNKCGIKIEEVSSSVLYNVVIAALRTNTNRDIKLLCH